MEKNIRIKLSNLMGALQIKDNKVFAAIQDGKDVNLRLLGEKSIALGPNDIVVRNESFDCMHLIKGEERDTLLLESDIVKYGIRNAEQWEQWLDTIIGQFFGMWDQVEIEVQE